MFGKITLAGVTALLAANAAWAGSQFESVLSRCATLNCSGMTIRGIHQSREPFVVQVYARAGECLRLEISEQSGDTAMSVLGPSVYDEWYSDDRDFDGGDFRPLVFQDELWVTGWFTVTISHFDYVADVVRFNLEYGRYPAGSINCPAPVATAELTYSPRSDIAGKNVRPAATLPVD